MSEAISIALVDDHLLFRAALASYINRLEGYRVTMEADNGRLFIESLQNAHTPQVLLLDIVMPEVNGFDTALWLSKNHPQIKIIALTMLQDESTIIRMLRNGVKGYIAKDAEIRELEMAIQNVMANGIHINRHLYDHILYTIHDTLADEEPDYKKVASLSPREKEFLKLLCSDKAYKEIAADMYVSPRTVDGYRDSLFTKLKVASRIGLVLFAIRNHIVQV